MAISASVTNQQITASVGESVIDVTVSGGIGPTGATGPAGATTWVGITDKPSAFNPTQHAATHAIGGVDYISPAAIGAATIQAAESLQLQVDGKAASSHTHPASAITSGTISSARLPVSTTSQVGGIVTGTGLTVASGVLSVTYGSNSTSACRGDDARLTNARQPTAHSHASEDISDFVSAVTAIVNSIIGQ